MATNPNSEKSNSCVARVIDNIKKSNSDPWHYRGLELSNEMFVVLISHPDIDKAAAALDVYIGSLADPKDVPGIAHFLEHMLFMGSTKYPGENDYSKLIEGNGGFSNAFTSGDHTNYYFDINPSQLPEALDVFAQFFISPLFDASSTDRELEAVNSEYEGNVSKDAWRISQLEKSTSNPDHPYSRFSIGNTESLRTVPKQRGIDIRQVLLDFHRDHYSSNRMSLAVLGNQSLDELQSLVIKSFCDVKNKNLKKVHYPADPYGEKKRQTICYVVPVKENRHLTINWAIPDHQDLYFCNPESYVSHLIGHEGDGSILSHLKKLGLASELSSGEKNTAPGFSFFTVDIDLTIEGLQQWKKVLLIVYQYMAMLRREKPKQWIFDECKNVNAMQFQFKEKERPDDFVSNLAGRIRDYPLVECLSGDYELREFRPDLIEELLDEYLIPTKMRVFLVSKDFASIATEQEKWFGTQYKEEYFEKDFIESCVNCQPIAELHLPKPNEFIPTDFQIFANEKPCSRPEVPKKIQENEFFRLFYADDCFYKLPKAYIYFEFRNPLASVDPLHSNMNALYVELIDDSLTELVYPAEIGGLKYELTSLSYGIQLSLHGFNHRIKQLLNTIIDRMVNIQINVQSFEIMKEKVKRSLQNFRRDVPYQMAIFGVTYLTAEHHWNKDELLSCIDGITIDDLKAFIPRMLTRLYTDSLMYGNLTKDHALELMNDVQDKFQQRRFHQALFPSLWFNQRELNLPEGCNYAYTMLNDAHKLHAIEIYFQCFQQSVENNGILELFAHFVDEPCFDQLRTKEQLGYIVNSGVRRSRGVQGFRVIVQSARDLEHVNRRIELFLDSVKDYIEAMPDELFEKQRQGCIVKKLEIPKRMHSQGNKFWAEITSHQFCFNRPLLELEIIKKLEREDLLKFYDRYISPRSNQRRKLALHVNPSPVALRSSSNGKSSVDSDEEISSTTTEEAKPTGEIQHEAESLTEQPQIIDVLIKTSSLMVSTTKTDLEIPKDEWIGNVHEWKSKLPCYPLAQSYEKIDIPVLCKL